MQTPSTQYAIKYNAPGYATSQSAIVSTQYARKSNESVDMLHPK